MRVLNSTNTPVANIRTRLHKIDRHCSINVNFLCIKSGQEIFSFNVPKLPKWQSLLLTSKLAIYLRDAKNGYFLLNSKVARMAVKHICSDQLEAKVFSIDCCAYSSSVALIVVQNRYRSRIHHMYCFCYLATSLRHNGCLLKLQGHQSTVVWSQAILNDPMLVLVVIAVFIVGMSL